MNKINIQVVILAAGQSSRCYPFNDSHKSMVRVLGKPILEHTINGLKKEGIKEIILVIGKNNAIKEYFGDGRRFGISIDYVVQIEPQGMGNALLLAEKKVKGDFLLLSAHRIDAHKFINSLLKNKLSNRAKAVLLVKQKENTQIHGVLKIEKNRVLEVVEKPKIGDEPSNLCVVGIYFLPYEFLKTLKNTPYEHYSLEKAISAYAKENFVSYVETKDELVTLRYPWNLLEVKDYLFKHMKKSISPKAKIAKSTEIIGEVVIEEGAVLMEGVRIKGPCYIGRNSVIGNSALIRNSVDVEENCVIGAYMEVKNSLVMRGATTHSGFIGDSIIGENCKISAQFCTGNARLDRKAVKVVVKGEKLETGKKHLGAMIGTNTNIGIKSSTMPGVIIGRNVIIGPSTVVMKNIPDNTKYYTKFKEYVSKKNVLRHPSAPLRTGAKDLQKPIVLFDIDYTLFDVEYFDKRLSRELSKKFTIEEDKIRFLSSSIITDLIQRESFLNIDKYIERLLSKLKKDKDKSEIEHLLFETPFFKKGFYEEVEETLKLLKKNSRLGIFSQGHEKLQAAKIKQSGFMDLFEQDLIYIIKPRKLDFLPLLKSKHSTDKVYLVEDKPSIIQAVKDFMPSIFTIWIERGKYAESQKNLAGFLPDATVANLREAVKIINSKI